MFLFLFSAIVKSEIPPSLPHRRDVSKASSNYFNSFELTRKSYSSNSILGFKINTKINGIDGIVKEYMEPYKAINFTAAILDLLNQFDTNYTIEGAEPIPEIKHQQSLKDMILQHVLSFLTYIIPIIAITVITIILIAIRPFVHRKIPGKVYKNRICYIITRVIFVSFFVINLIGICLLIVACSLVDDVIATVEDLPQTFLNIQSQDFMQYYSLTVDKADDLGNVWKTDGIAAIDVIIDNVTTVGNQVISDITDFGGKLVYGSSSILDTYSNYVDTNVKAAQSKLEMYEEYAHFSQELEDESVLSDLNTIKQTVDDIYNMGQDILYYITYFGNIEDLINSFLEDSEEYPDEEYPPEEGYDEEMYSRKMHSIKRHTRETLNHTYKPIELKMNFEKYTNLCRTILIVCAVVIVFAFILSIIYLIVVLPFFKSFSTFIAKFSCFLPFLFIIAFCVIGFVFSVVGGIFAYYVNQDVENTLDTAISEVFNIFPDRTLVIPNISLEYFTKGAFNTTFSLGDYVFSDIEIFKQIKDLDSNEGLYKALKLDNIFNITDFVMRIGNNVDNLGTITNSISSMFSDKIRNFYNDIKSILPQSFASFYQFMHDEYQTKPTYIKNQIMSSTSIPENDKQIIIDCLDNIDYYINEMNETYNDAYNMFDTTLVDLFEGLPNSLLDIVRYACTHFGGTIQKSAPIIDQMVNQIPVGFAQGVYNIFYNAFFTDLIEASSFFSSGSLIIMICIPAMLICIMFSLSLKDPRSEFPSDNFYFVAP